MEDHSVCHWVLMQCWLFSWLRAVGFFRLADITTAAESTGEIGSTAVCSLDDIAREVISLVPDMRLGDPAVATTCDGVVDGVEIIVKKMSRGREANQLAVKQNARGSRCGGRGGEESGGAVSVWVSLCSTVASTCCIGAQLAGQRLTRAEHSSSCCSVVQHVVSLVRVTNRYARALLVCMSFGLVSGTKLRCGDAQPRLARTSAHRRAATICNLNGG